MVHFALDRHDLAPASRNVLAALVDSLRYFPTVQIVLEGHTDLRASVEYNLALSRRRTLSVKSYLELLGIDPSRIRIVAQGKSQLRTTGTDPLAHARNRRVQLRYFTPDGRELEATQLLDDLQLESRPVRRPRPRPTPPR
jgi:outer membrane protein OmpA-like peptidoglycan-associated protein